MESTGIVDALSPIDFLGGGSNVNFPGGRSPIDFLESTDFLESGKEGAPARPLVGCLRPWTGQGALGLARETLEIDFLEPWTGHGLFFAAGSRVIAVRGRAFPDAVVDLTGEEGVDAVDRG